MYKVFRISENSNSFGLKQFYAMNDKGEMMRACANYLNIPKMGQSVDPNRGGFELIEKLGEAPSEVVKEVGKMLKALK